MRLCAGSDTYERRYVPINVTAPFLPPKEEYLTLIDQIWDRGWLTNNGPIVVELEAQLSKYLEVDELKYISNGTVALQIAIRALGMRGEVITTPFSYVATTSSLVWEHCTPVMVDIDPETLNIDATKIEAAITEKTTGILATHVYGNPCDVDAIDEIAKRRGLRVLYDGAHAFGTRLNGRSVFQYGDASMLSFHATKLFHTIEGGGITSRHPDIRYLVGQMRNFGHTSPTSFDLAGINGKGSEFHAAMGLCNLRHIDRILSSRKMLSEIYDQKLAGLVVRPKLLEGTEYNYSYYPVIFESENIMLKCLAQLAAQEVFPRRYFFPTLSSLPYIQSDFDTPVADDISRRVVCLPLYADLPAEDVLKICELIGESLN